MLLAVTVALARAETPAFETDVLPILTRNCMGCHGGLKQKGELDLRTIAAMLKGGESGPAVVTGKPAESGLWVLIEKDKMPKGETKLSADEKRVIHAWIAAGMPTVKERQRETRPLLAPGARHEPAKVADAIDKHIETQLDAAGMQPAPLCEDEAFLRRVYLDLSGRVPNPAQAKAFLDDPSSDKRTKLIDALLASPEFGQQLGRTWRDWICPPELPSDMNGGKQPHKEAQELGDWFARRFAAGDAWDAIVRDLLMVKGDIKNQPEVIFYGLVGQDAKITPEGLASSVASLFMGVQLQCAQCHDDPYRDWSQNEFWALAAYFGGTTGDFKKVDEKGGDGKITIPKSAFLNAGTKVPAAFLRANAAPKQSKDANRASFVHWLTGKENPYFARAFANRLWFYFFSRGIVNPVDDIRELNPPSHPALLSLLESEFRDSGYDIKHMIRCICNSQAYQRSSAVPQGLDETKAQMLADGFGRRPLRVMSADMLLESLKLAYGDPKLDLRGIDPKDGNSSGESAPVGDPYVEFQRDFCIDEEDPTDFSHGIPQMLTFLNHPRLHKGGKSLEELLKANASIAPEQVIEWLYLATLSRRPTEVEAAEAMQYVSKSGSAPEAYSGLLWMLVNRSEFILVR